VSIAGTVGVMWFLGYSIDVLSLMALTISVGFVVDDAIVMVENVVRHREAGHPSLQATLMGSRQVAFTVVSITASLLAALIPLLCMPGIVGRFMQEFAVTLSAAIAISAIVSLTLAPALSARFGCNNGDIGRLRTRSVGGCFFRFLLDGYVHSLRW